MAAPGQPRTAPPPPSPLPEPRTRLLLRHHTAYRYDRPVVLGPQTIRLHPTPHASARILSYALTIVPQDNSLRWHQDPAGNVLARVLFPAPVMRLDLDVEMEIEIGPANPFDFIVEPEAATWPFEYPEDLAPELVPFRTTEPAGPGMAALLAELTGAEQPTTEALTQLARVVRDRIAYRVRFEAGVQGPEQTLASSTGSCRDSAWLLVQLLRRRGFAARFVSGYLLQLVEGQSGAPGADELSLHAWAEAYLPGAGWIGLDSTSGLLTGEAHIPLAAGASPSSSAPISGTVEQATAAFEVAMSVTRVAPDAAHQETPEPARYRPVPPRGRDRGQ